MRYLRAVLAMFLIYLLMAIMGITFAIPAALSRDWAYRAIKTYCEMVFWVLRVFCNIRVEQRGTLPDGNVVVISKHQSFLDVIMHIYFLPRATFVMKQELRYAPFLGFYAMRIGVAPVKRGAKGRAVKQMMAGVKRNSAETQQLVIYPQGTRVPPGIHRPYKIGAGVLAERTGRPCILAATNTGVFWPKYGVIRRSGVAVIEYLHEVPNGLKLEAFMDYIEGEIETASDKLVAESGFETPLNDDR